MIISNEAIRTDLLIFKMPSITSVYSSTSMMRNHEKAEINGNIWRNVDPLLFVGFIDIIYVPVVLWCLENSYKNYWIYKKCFFFKYPTHLTRHVFCKQKNTDLQNQAKNKLNKFSAQICLGMAFVSLLGATYIIGILLTCVNRQFGNKILKHQTFHWRVKIKRANNDCWQKFLIKALKQAGKKEGLFRPGIKLVAVCQTKTIAKTCLSKMQKSTKWCFRFL